MLQAVGAVCMLDKLQPAALHTVGPIGQVYQHSLTLAPTGCLWYCELREAGRKQTLCWQPFDMHETGDRACSALSLRVGSAERGTLPLPPRGWR